MGRKGGRKRKVDSSRETPSRRGKRRSIRYDAVQEDPHPKRPSRGPEAPPTIHLRKISAAEALDRLAAQLLAFSRQGQREVLVVHGKGQNSVGGVAVIGPLARQWCDDHPDLVKSWREAPRHWGGSGAIVVVLN